MKKIFIIVALLSSALFGERYLMFLEYEFVKGCSEGKDASVNQCICMLTEIEKTTPQAEMVEFSLKAASGEKIPDALSGKIMGAALKCNGNNQ
ncbi:MAG: hypothetical protein RLZZ428_432 [Pseudomonadota bacterium]|jgi:hypothetical protein